ncbi:MAG: hypothetical protein AAF569_06010 [Pseudomonadota bacterium]
MPKRKPKDETLARKFLQSGDYSDLAQLIATVGTAQKALRRCYTVLFEGDLKDIPKTSNATMLAKIKKRKPLAEAGLRAALR